VCEIPPDGLMVEWCEYHAEAFTRHSCAGFVEAACLEARFVCPGGDLPEWFDENPEGTGGTGNGGSGTGSTGSGATGSGTGGNEIDDVEGSHPGNSRDSTETGGCSCSTTSRSMGSGSRAFLVLGLFGALIALRRSERKFL